jgi:RND family efflux transporter MFP subunit
MRTVRYAIILFSLAVLFGGCGSDNANEQDTKSPDPIVSVRIAPVRRVAISERVSVDGMTDVLDRERIIAPIDGTVVTLTVDVGAKVNAGDTLTVIRTRDSEAAIAGARRLLDQATTQHQRDQAKRAMEVAQESQQLVTITAGRSGEVVNRMVSIGQTINADAELIELVDLSTLEFVASIPLSDLTQIRVGQQADITFPSLPESVFSGRVKAVSAQSDPGSQSAPVRLEFTTQQNRLNGLLRVNMMGTASITVGEHTDALVVPSKALLRDDLTDTYTIFTVGPDSLARQLSVTVGIVSDSVTEVNAPTLIEGEQVITEGNYEVSDSTRITASTGGTE